jgi:hypothetical protein
MNFNIRIDLSKVDQTYVFAGKNGARYLDVAILETKPSNFGDQRDESTHVVIQSLPKQERDGGKKGAILGNMKPFSSGKSTAPAVRQPSTNNPLNSKEADEDEIIPF